MKSKKTQNTGEVRIIGGALRSRKICFPATTELRPTPQRIRETLFNWLASSIVDATCLDLFAGSGALGFEALSRGAKQVTFVDHDPVIIAHLKKTLSLFNLQNTNLIKASTPNLTLAEQFDIVFLDPPFNQNRLKECCLWLKSQTILKANALIYLEAEHKLQLDFLPANWVLLKSKSAGEVGYHLCQSRLD